MTSTFFNRVKFRASNTGTADFTVGTAADGHRTLDGAGVPDGTTVSYTACSVDKSQWEVGYGVYHSTTTILGRDTVRESSTGSKINFTTAPDVWLDIHAQDASPEVGTPVTITPSGGTITPEFSTGINFTCTLNAAGMTLANPGGSRVGQSGIIRFVQDGTGGRTITSLGSMWIVPGATLTLGSAAGAVDILSYFVYSGSYIYATISWSSTVA